MSEAQKMADGMVEQWHDHLAVAAASESLIMTARAVGELLCDRFAAGGILYTMGNGGSAADAQHLSGELIGHYRRDRRPLPAVTLTTDATVTTCIANDYDFDSVFSRQVEALARKGDVVAAFTTSGRSANIIRGLEAAKANGATTVLFAGGDGGPALALADQVLLVPSAVTPRVQEVHTLLLHVISELIDDWADR
ncbi:SIS domain-containing protein [Gryllotalpicola reticulitermitis]|uniref:SIS domain-containing protein n=1 Tax=Gryllotalpicola reticulitermitis TaxID=1184153 RepID=A0ABV8Q7A5_9MICO